MHAHAGGTVEKIELIVDFRMGSESEERTVVTQVDQERLMIKCRGADLDPAGLRGEGVGHGGSRFFVIEIE